MNTDFNKLWENTVREEETALLLFEQWVDLSQAAPELQALASLVAVEACRVVRASLNIREVWLLVCKPTPLQTQAGHWFIGSAFTGRVKSSDSVLEQHSC